MGAKYLLFNAAIDTRTANLLSSAIVECINDKTIDEIVIGMSTTGGGVAEGIALHHIIRSCPKHITIHALGNIDSIGLTVFLGAKIRLAVPGTRFFFHSLGTTLSQRVDISVLSEKIAGLRNDESRIVGIWITQVKLKDRELTALFKSEHVNDCEWALARGFIHKVCDFSIRAGAPIANVF